MKYMGSKRAMLQNGLGKLLRAESKTASRFVDLFSGAASVSWFAATKLDKPVMAVDLQQYAAVLAKAVVRRVKPSVPDDLDNNWLKLAEEARTKLSGWKEADELDSRRWNIATWRKKAQQLCADRQDLILRAYGGHYFSPTQALTFDAMIATLPDAADQRDICLATTIISASRCAASPGHTAQPFKATRTAGRYLREAWQREPLQYARRALKELCPLHAKHQGEAIVGDANDTAKELKEDDVVFVDPPYSGVHYSRFYHVLETIARGRCGEVEGVGRYPPPEERPASRYSKKTEARTAIEDLFKSLSSKGCTVILTFPKDDCSNGLSGEDLQDLAKGYFNVTKRSIKTRFSTLGGNTTNREARKVSDELMLVLKP